MIQYKKPSILTSSSELGVNFTKISHMRSHQNESLRGITSESSFYVRFLHDSNNNSLVIVIIF